MPNIEIEHMYSNCQLIDFFVANNLFPISTVATYYATFVLPRNYDSSQAKFLSMFLFHETFVLFTVVENLSWRFMPSYSAYFFINIKIIKGVINSSLACTSIF